MVRLRCERCDVTYSHWEEHKCAKPVTKRVTTVTKPVTPAVNVTESVTGECPTCGRPYPLSNAERQRRYRERQKANA